MHDRLEGKVEHPPLYLRHALQEIMSLQMILSMGTVPKLYVPKGIKEMIAAHWGPRPLGMKINIEESDDGQYHLVI